MVVHESISFDLRWNNVLKNTNYYKYKFPNINIILGNLFRDKYYLHATKLIRIYYLELSPRNRPAPIEKILKSVPSGIERGAPHLATILLSFGLKKHQMKIYY